MQEGGDAMSEPDGKTPVAVRRPQAAGKRAGEAAPQRSTAEPSVWTARMLATLSKGVTGGKWCSLIDKVYSLTTLRAAFAVVSANGGAAGVDHVSTADYAANLDANLARLSEALRTGSYRPQAIRRHYIPKPRSQDRWASQRCRTAWRKRRCAWCWNRYSSGTSPPRATAFAPVWVQGRAATGRRAAESGPSPCGRCRSEELCRHHPEGSPAGPGGRQGVGWPHPRAARSVPRAEGA